jgi:predicted metal-dependent hydrolase
MDITSRTPLIVAFVGDLMFTTKIDNVIRHLGYQVQWVGDPAVFDGDRRETKQETLGEKLHGQEGQLFIEIASWQPALLLFDLANQAIPWRQWIPMLKSSAATRRIPIMAFGPHVDVEMMQEAKRIGAEFVFARSRFSSKMPQLLQEHVAVPEYDAINAACEESLTGLARSGIEKFNQGAFYACHDDLEEAWRQESSPARDLYRGLLQIAVAYYQIEQGNYRGATKMLLRMRQWLDPMPPVCQGVNVAKVLEDATAVQDALNGLGPKNIGEFDQTLFRPIEFNKA